ncbi:hypothetical protein IAD21_03105 [Abditibacteriota bacterium]|nr:hypothetical protein IAD21_03105 [Abditibacteriota bacterium]
MLYFLTLYAVFKVLRTQITLTSSDVLATRTEAKDLRKISRFNHSLTTSTLSAKRNLTLTQHFRQPLSQKLLMPLRQVCASFLSGCLNTLQVFLRLQVFQLILKLASWR